MESLHELPRNSVHTAITSPPYYNQRDYDVVGQIGTEDSVIEYISSLTGVFDELSDVVRKDGSLLLNIGDTFVNKEKQCIPNRLAISISDKTKWKVREVLPWVKKNTKPDPADDRRSVNHEWIFHFVQSNDYWYDESVTDGSHSSVIETQTANSNNSHTAVFPQKLVKELLKGTHPNVVCSVCGKPYSCKYEKIPRPFTNPDRKQSLRALEIFKDSELTKDHVDAIQSVGISDTGKAVETEDGAGKNAEDKKILASEAKDILGGYYREFTMVEKEFTGYTQSCDCDSNEKGGTICDPFVGSGTTCVVAESKNQNFIGIDLNFESCKTTVERCSSVDNYVKQNNISNYF